MIETTIRSNLSKWLKVKVLMQLPEEKLDSFVVFEKIGSRRKNYLDSATFAFQSYADSLYEAAKLNEKVKKAVERLLELDSIRGVKLQSDYNFTDTQTKRYRYQAVYDIEY